MSAFNEKSKGRKKYQEKKRKEASMHYVTTIIITKYGKVLCVKGGGKFDSHTVRSSEGERQTPLLPANSKRTRIRIIFYPKIHIQYYVCTCVYLRTFERRLWWWWYKKRGSTESVLTDFAQLRSRQPVAKGKEREKWEQKIICIIAVYYTVYIIKVRKYFSQRFTKKKFHAFIMHVFVVSAVYHLYWYVHMYSSVSFYNRHIYKRK